MRTKQYYNYTVVSFDSLIKKINVDVINHYFDNGLELVKINRDFKKIFVHYCIKNFCTDFQELKGVTDKIVFCNPKIISPKSEMFDIIDYKDYVKFLKRILKDLDSVLPFTLYFSEVVEFDNIDQLDTNDLKFTFDYIHSTSGTNKSIHKLTKYVQGLGLNYLSKDYLSRPNLHKVFI